MTGFTKALSFLAGAAALLAVSAGDAQAALQSYIGRGSSTTSGSGTAISTWFQNSWAASTTLTPAGVTGSGTGAMTVPLATSSGLTLTSSQTGGATTLSLGTAGSLKNAPSGSVFVDSNAATAITISNFSPLVNSFGFFLENARTAAGATQTGTVTITMTDSKGATSQIQVTATGTVTSTTTLSQSTAAAGGAGLFNGTTLTDGTQNAQFVGFTSTNPISSVVISAGTGVTWELGNFYEGKVPEPASMALLGAGLAGLGVIRRRRKV